MSTHKEQHLVGKPITVVYEITDPTVWRAKNPLQYEHDSLKAYCVSTGDLAARCDELRTALETIVSEGDRESRAIAGAALDADNR